MLPPWAKVPRGHFLSATISRSSSFCGLEGIVLQAPPRGREVRPTGGSSSLHNSRGHIHTSFGMNSTSGGPLGRQVALLVGAECGHELRPVLRAPKQALWIPQRMAKAFPLAAGKRQERAV